MPRPKTERRLIKRVEEITEQHRQWSARDVLAQLRKEPDGQDGLPTERTVARIRREYKDRVRGNPKLALLNQFFSWPESMESGFLPWGASAVALEFMRWWREINYGGMDKHPLKEWAGEKFIIVPTNKYVLWFWRISQAAPDAPIGARWALTELMIYCRMYPEFDIFRLERRVEYALTYAPWRSRKNSYAYNQAILRGEIISLFPVEPGEKEGKTVPFEEWGKTLGPELTIWLGRDFEARLREVKSRKVGGTK